jgi:hypothetical protein
MHGTSFTYSFDDADAAERHTQQYFEILGNRGMYKDGWWLSMMMPRIPWKLDPETLKRFAPGVWDPRSDPAGLYYLPDDYTQANDLAAQHPDKVKELQELFWEEAARYQVFPLLGGVTGFFGIRPPASAQSEFTYYGDTQNVAPGVIPPIHNHSYSISAELEIPEGGAEGVIGAAAGGVAGKFAKHRLESGIGEKMDAALPPSSAGVIAVYDSGGAAAVDDALSNAVKKSVAHIDGTKAKGAQGRPRRGAGRDEQLNRPAAQRSPSSWARSTASLREVTLSLR